MNKKNIKYLICLSLIIFGCNLSENINNNIKNDIKSINNKTKNNESKPPMNNPNDVKKSIFIGERNLYEVKNNFSIVHDFKLFDENKGLVFLQNGDILFLSNNSLEKINTLKPNHVGKMCLNSNGSGLIFYVSGYAHQDTSLRNKLEMAKIKDYKIIEKDIIIDNQIQINTEPECSIDKDGNGIILYPGYYAKKIDNLNVLNKITDISRGYNFVIDNQNILRVESNHDIKLININIESPNSPKEVILTKDSITNIYTHKNSNNVLSLLAIYSDGKSEVIRIKDFNSIKRSKINFDAKKNIDSFYIDENGNGIIVYYKGDEVIYSQKLNKFIIDDGEMAILKVNNFIIDYNSNVSYKYKKASADSVENNFSNISIFSNKGYVFWSNGYDNSLNYHSLNIVDVK